MGTTGNDRHLSFERHLDGTLGRFLVFLLSRLPARRGRDGADPRRILLIKLHGIGNVVCLLPAIRCLRRRFPDAAIDFLTFSTNRGIVEGMKELTAVHLVDRGTMGSLARSLARVGPRLARAGYDLVVDFDQFAHFSALAALVTRAPRRVGYMNPALGRHRAYTVAVPCLDIHVARTFLRVAAHAAGLPAVPPLADADRPVDLLASHRAEAEAFCAAEGIGPDDALVLLHPGTSANLVLRRWPAERFAELGDRLAALPGVRVAVSGGAEEAGLVERVRSAMRTPAPSTAGRLSLLGYAALTARAALMVSNDTAAVHIASAMGTPVAGIYGPNTPLLYGPLGAHDLVFYHELPCSPCITNYNAKLSSCRAARCVEAVTVDEVFGAIRAACFDPGGALLPRFRKAAAAR